MRRLGSRLTAHPDGSVAARQGHLLGAVARAVPRQPCFRSGNSARGRHLVAGQAGISSLGDGPRHNRRLHGRLAAAFFTGSGLLGLVTLPIPAPGLDVTATAAISAVAIALGIATWLAPWQAWPRQASLGLVPPTFTLIALASVYSGANLQTYGVFFLVCFAWIGMSHPPGTAAAMAPLAAAAYALPLAFLHGRVVPGLYAAAITIPVCVLVGEGIAWSLRRLEQMEGALRRERDRTEHFRELDEKKNAFISSVSHELRTPITICRGHLDVLVPGADEREVQAVKETLVTELKLMTRLVEDLTTLARVDDRAQLRIEALPLEGFVGTITKKAESILGKRLRVEKDAGAMTLRADPQRLTQALLNLLRNAAEHAQGDGPVRFRVRAEDSSCCFEVADDGAGLLPGDEEIVFEPFRTGSSPTAGSGLGLSIVRGIARAHGGDSGVVSRPGQGATFWIRIPW
jgi:signal transduction histidine kinase